MLLFSVLGGFLLIAILVVSYMFVNLLFIQSQLQKCSDEIAVRGACQLNNLNRIGQVNNLVARCRQLVYASRGVSRLTHKVSPDLQTLADQILDEDRESAQYLEAERLRLQKLSVAESEKAVQSSFLLRSDLYRALAPWLKIQAPQIVSVDFGYTVNTDSNVLALDGIEDLAAYDEHLKYINPISKLYYGNINAKLPDEDTDLDFRLSSLAAPVNGNVSPARLITPEVFQQQAQVAQKPQLQSATRVIISAQVPSAVTGESLSTIRISSVAASNGAGPAQ